MKNNILEFRTQQLQTQKTPYINAVSATRLLIHNYIILPGSKIQPVLKRIKNIKT